MHWAPLRSPPLLRIERPRSCLISVRYGCHVNGFTRKNGEVYIWLAKRALSKPTYPGRWTRCSGELRPRQSAGERQARGRREASIPRDILDGNLRASACRTGTPRGLPLGQLRGLRPRFLKIWYPKWWRDRVHAHEGRGRR